MGKNKQAQRTKNNARPSSSGRSAELLGASVPNFVGFSAVKDGGYVPVLPGLAISAMDEIETNKLDSSFQLVLKKMNKKDATTKLKALQEFGELCSSSEMAGIESVLPFWPRLYCLLAVDVEHRVREAAHLAHTAVVKRVGRNIAPYLKQLAGPWFTSQYDTYPPAASAATNAFHETFPPKKLVDAIIHCQEEILTYICDNITVQTAQSLSTHKTVTPEEMEARYQRVLISSLQGYSLYLKTIPPDQIEKMLGLHRKIISSNRFWKLAKHDAPLIRAAFFNVLAAMIERTEGLLKDEKKKTVTTIMNSLDESEPGVLPALWETVLLAISRIEEWHTVVSIEKLVLPKLWRVLRGGGQGSAHVIYPNLLPFISHFPNRNIDNLNLYANFFDNLRQGFKVKSVQLSRSEMLAVVTSFIECLRYVVLQNTENQDLCEKLLQEQLLPTIEWCIRETTPIKPMLFNHITHLVRYWSRNRDVQEYKSYSHLMRQFWAQLEILLYNLINSTNENFDADDITNLQNAQLDLLLSLKNPNVLSRKHLRVKFTVPPDELAETENRVKPNPVSDNGDDDGRFLSELGHLVNNICIAYFANIETARSGNIIRGLEALVSNFESRELFVALAKSYKTDATLLEFYEGTLGTWLTNKPEQSEAVIRLVFSLVRYLDKTNKDAVLASLAGIDNATVLRHALWCALSKKNRNDTVSKDWFSQSGVAALLIDTASQVAANVASVDSYTNESILMRCFESSGAGDLSIDETVFNNIASILCGALNKPDRTDLNSLAELLSHLYSLTWELKRPTSGCIQILEALFQLSCIDDSDECIIPSESTVRESWKRGLVEIRGKLSATEFVGLAKRLAAVIWEKTFSLHYAQFKDRLVDVASDFLEAVVDNGRVDDELDHAEEIIVGFLTDSRLNAWLADVTAIVLYGEVVSGNIYIPESRSKIRIGKDLVTVDLEKKSPPDNIENCLRWALFNAKLLNKLLSKRRREIENNFEDRSNEEEDNSESIPRAAPHCTVPAIVFEETLANIVYIATLAHLYGRHYKSTRYYNGVSVLLGTLKEEFKKLHRFVSGDVHERLRGRFENAHTCGDIWPRVLHLYCTELGPGAHPADHFVNYIGSVLSLGEKSETGVGVGCIQAVQVFSDYLKPKDIPPLTLENDTNALIIARSMLTKDGDNVTLALEVLERVMKRYEENSSLLLFDRDVSGATWEELTLPLETIRLLTKFVVTTPTQMTSAQWDFALISLASWQLSVNKSKRCCDCLKVIALTVAVCQLFHAVQKLLAKHETEPIEQLPATLPDEWKNVFADDLYVGLTRTWMIYAESYNQRGLSAMRVIPLDNLGEALKSIGGKIFLNEEGREQVIALALKILQSPVPSLQLAAYHALKHVVRDLVESDKATIETDHFDPNTLKIRKLEAVVSSTQNIVNAILMEFKLCETVNCTIQPYTDSYTYTLGYLLVWAIVLDMCSHAHAELRYQYAELLKDDFFACLLNNLFRLMPVEVLQDNKTKTAKLVEIFSTAPSLGFSESWTERRLDRLVCWLYANSLRHLPVLVRQWWGTADSRVSAAVDRITTLYVSPMLCQEELLGNKLTDIENMQVKVHPTAREVVALYQVEDAKLELSIVLPVNHPLGPVTVEPGQHAGGSANWRNCHMQLSIFLTHQNGSIWDGLTLWKRNLDKRFSGVEECYICFSILHASTYQIPKLSCHTCRKKFHTPCLYKWFSTSQKSTCPICRNVF